MDFQLNPISTPTKVNITNLDWTDVIYSFVAPAFNLSAERNKDSQVDFMDEFEYEGVSYEILVLSSMYELFISINSNDENGREEQFDVYAYQEERGQSSSLKYMPYIQVTRKTEEIITGIRSPKVIPFLSIDDSDDTKTNKRIASYEKVNIKIPHFIEYHEKIEYNSKAIKTIVIPDTITRNTKQAIGKLQVAEKHIALKFNTQNLATITSVLDQIFQNIKVSIIINIGEMSNNGINKITITGLLEYFDKNKVDFEIFILSSSIPENINTVCTSSSQSTIDNISLTAFNDLEIFDARLHYGDYCGYEVSTPTEYIQGMRIIPKTIMLSISGFSILIVRTCNVNYKWKEGMEEIFSMLKNDTIYNNFTHKVTGFCEGCKYLLDGTRTTATPELVKVSCMKHNIKVMETIVAD